MKGIKIKPISRFKKMVHKYVLFLLFLVNIMNTLLGIYFWKDLDSLEFLDLFSGFALFFIGVAIPISLLYSVIIAMIIVGFLSIIKKIIKLDRYTSLRITYLSKKCILWIKIFIIPGVIFGGSFFIIAILRWV